MATPKGIVPTPGDDFTVFATRSTMDTVPAPLEFPVERLTLLFVTTPRLRRGMRATPAGAVPTAMDGRRMPVFNSMMEMLLHPMLATTAKSNVSSTATADGCGGPDVPVVHAPLKSTDSTTVKSVTLEKLPAWRTSSAYA